MEFLAEFFDTSGAGGVVVAGVVVSLVTAYGLTIRWISRGEADKKGEEH